MMFKEGNPPSLILKAVKQGRSGFKEICVFHTDLTIATETRDILQLLADEKNMPLEGFITKVLTEYIRKVLRRETDKFYGTTKQGKVWKRLKNFWNSKTIERY